MERKNSLNQAPWRIQQQSAAQNPDREIVQCTCAISRLDIATEYVYTIPRDTSILSTKACAAEVVPIMHGRTVVWNCASIPTVTSIVTSHAIQ